MLYHVSPAAGLTVLEPRVSTHGQPWVYALADEVTALLFGARQDDFDFCIDTNEDGLAEVWECWPGALQGCYGGQRCSVYEISEVGFLSGQTGWSPEWVCPAPVPVLRETPVPDLYARLTAEAARGSLILHRWEDTPDYRARISNHVVDRLIRWNILDHPIPPRLTAHFGPLIEALQAVLDGRYL